jgi:hypothetical protein
MEEKKYLPKNVEKWLPSRNLQYPQSFRLYYYPFSFGELKRINTSYTDEVQIFEEILNGIEVDGMPKEDLTFYDVVYLGWRRKVSTFGTALIDVNSFCPNCDFNNKMNRDLKNVDFTDTDITKLPVKVRVYEIELHFGFITIKQYLELMAQGLHNDIIAVLAKSVINMEYEEAYQLLASATGNDLDKINLLPELLYHGIKPIEAECKECGNKYQVDLSDSQEVELLKPFRTKEEIIRDGISFGN